MKYILEETKEIKKMFVRQHEETVFDFGSCETQIGKGMKINTANEESCRNLAKNIYIYI